MKRRDEPVPMSEAIAAVGRDLGLAAPDVLATINAGWAGIVGPAIAEHAQVRSVRDGEC
ncbi:MAG: Dna[CI] antecedent, DciA, partial [Actinomycetota bacterium]|nr:Dna[CI] antecedent, DciA [Actinomycetota bacterium]